MSEGGEGEVTLSLAMHVLQASSGRSLRSLFPSAASPCHPTRCPSSQSFPHKIFLSSVFCTFASRMPGEGAGAEISLCGGLWPKDLAMRRSWSSSGGLGSVLMLSLCAGHWGQDLCLRSPCQPQKLPVGSDILDWHLICFSTFSL